MRFVILIGFLLSFLGGGPAFAADQPHEPKANLTILADAEFMLPAAQLVRSYSRQTDTPLTLVLKNPAEAEAQIMQGLEAHVLLTADANLVERLANQGLTDVNSTRAITTGPATYKVMVLASESMEASRAFAEFLQSADARTILARFGYQSPKP